MDCIYRVNNERTRGIKRSFYCQPHYILNFIDDFDQITQSVDILYVENFKLSYLEEKNFSPTNQNFEELVNPREGLIPSFTGKIIEEENVKIEDLIEVQFLKDLKNSKQIKKAITNNFRLIRLFCVFTFRNKIPTDRQIDIYLNSIPRSIFNEARERDVEWNIKLQFNFKSEFKEHFSNTLHGYYARRTRKYCIVGALLILFAIFLYFWL